MHKFMRKVITYIPLGNKRLLNKCAARHCVATDQGSIPYSKAFSSDLAPADRLLKMSSLRFDGKVVVVTGAGGGLGKEYALLLGKRGASVVVNDLGGSGKGDGQSTQPADLVVQEIKSNGGKAVANYDSVENGDSIIKTAIDTFGRVDVVINNAGILRDRSLAKITDHDWDLINAVHLRGSFKVTRAAWPYMREQGYGRIIMTSSGSGIYGNFGQANYSAAKMGLIGLSNTVAVEGQKYNIHSNVIVPVAGSRLTQGLLPPELFDQFRPEYVAPVVVWLCHEDCEDTGGIFEAAGGWIGKYRWQRSTGKAFAAPDKNLTVEAVRDNWENITDMTDGSFPASNQEVIIDLGETINQTQESVENSESDNGEVDVNKIVGSKISNQKFSYTVRDVILYALGVGVSSADENYLKYLYEGSEDFSVLPTFGVIPAQIAMMNSGIFTGKIPGLQIDLAKVLHGEQYLELLQPLPVSGTLVSKASIADVLDKGSGAVILLNVDTYDSNDNHLVRNQFTVFAVGSGGFGGKRSSDKQILTEACPSRPPDATAQSKTTADQPAVYRLSGDYNPLHIDPNFAALGGFSQPILHGLCSFGIATRHILKQYANDDVTQFKAIKVRFTKPVIPGNTLQTEMWKNGNRIIFQSKILESGNVAVQGFLDLHSLHEIQAEPKKHIFESDEVFHRWINRFSGSFVAPKDVNACYQWEITKDGNIAQIWTVDFKEVPAKIFKGIPKNPPDVTLTLSDEDMAAIGNGELTAQKAYMNGKLKLKGNILLTTRLQKLFQKQANL